jgi:hypothetical protein
VIVSAVNEVVLDEDVLAAVCVAGTRVYTTASAVRSRGGGACGTCSAGARDAVDFPLTDVDTVPIEPRDVLTVDVREPGDLDRHMVDPHVLAVRWVECPEGRVE